MQWLVDHGVNRWEIAGSSGGPRWGLRREAGAMNRAQAYVRRGESDAARGDLDTAIAAFTEAIELELNFAPAHFGRGLAHEKKGNLDQAIEDFSEAIGFSTPGDMAHKAKVAEFMTDSNARVGLDVDLVAVHQARGRVYEKKGEAAKAREDFARAKELQAAQKTGTPKAK